MKIWNEHYTLSTDSRQEHFSLSVPSNSNYMGVKPKLDKALNRMPVSYWMVDKDDRGFCIVNCRGR